jgi:hypothetical protein
MATKLRTSRIGSFVPNGDTARLLEMEGGPPTGLFGVALILFNEPAGKSIMLVP